MNHVILDGACVRNRDELHDMLAARLPLPTWYGRNLDALYDSLTDIGEELVILLRSREDLEQNLGPYGSRFLAVVRDAAEENPYLSFQEIS